MVELLIYFNVDAMKCKAELCLHVYCIGRLEDTAYSLLLYEGETPFSNKKNSQVTTRASICEDLCD